MSLRANYVTVARQLRAGLASMGALPLLDRWAARSRTGKWSRSLLSIYDVEDLAYLDLPWWTFSSIDAVADFMDRYPAPRVLEWGSGASTVWLARRGAIVTAVEHDPVWASAVQRLLPEDARVSLRVVTATSCSGDADEIRSRKKGFENLDFRAYVEAIDEEVGTFDLIIIDGRAREQCLIRSVPRLRPGGLLVMDDVERKRYREAIETLGPGLEVTMTRGLGPCLPYPTRTAVIRKT